MADFLKYGVSHIQLSPGSLMMPDFSSARFYTPEELGWQLDNGENKEETPQDNNTIFIDPNWNLVAYTYIPNKYILTKYPREADPTYEQTRAVTFMWLLVNSGNPIQLENTEKQYKICGGFLTADNQHIRISLDSTNRQWQSSQIHYQTSVLRYNYGLYILELNNDFIGLTYDFSDENNYGQFEFEGWFRQDQPDVKQMRLEIYEVPTIK